MKHGSLDAASRAEARRQALRAALLRAWEHGDQVVELEEPDLFSANPWRATLVIGPGERPRMQVTLPPRGESNRALRGFSAYLLRVWAVFGLLARRLRRPWRRS